MYIGFHRNYHLFFNRAPYHYMVLCRNSVESQKRRRMKEIFKLKILEMFIFVEHQKSVKVFTPEDRQSWRYVSCLTMFRIILEGSWYTTMLSSTFPSSSITTTSYKHKPPFFILCVFLFCSILLTKSVQPHLTGFLNTCYLLWFHLKWNRYSNNQSSQKTMLLCHPSARHV